MSRAPLLVPALVGLLALADGCSAAQRATERTVLSDVLSAEQIACLVAAAFGTSEPDAVVAVCAIPPSLEHAAIDMLLASKQGIAMARPGASEPQRECR